MSLKLAFFGKQWDWNFCFFWFFSARKKPGTAFGRESGHRLAITANVLGTTMHQKNYSFIFYFSYHLTTDHYISRWHLVIFHGLKIPKKVFKIIFSKFHNWQLVQMINIFFYCIIRFFHWGVFFILQSVSGDLETFFRASSRAGTNSPRPRFPASVVTMNIAMKKTKKFLWKTSKIFLSKNPKQFPLISI